MTTTTVESVVAAAQELSPTEQLEVIEAITRVLQQQYGQRAIWSTSGTSAATLAATIRRTPPVTDLRHFAADFWPEDESADDINEYLARQRAIDRMYDLPNNDDTL